MRLDKLHSTRPRTGSQTRLGLGGVPAPSRPAPPPSRLPPPRSGRPDGVRPALPPSDPQVAPCRPPRHVCRLVPAPLPARRSAARAATTQAANQPRALPTAPLPARLGLLLQHSRLSAPPGGPASALPSAGPRAALECRLRRVSVPPPSALHPTRSTPATLVQRSPTPDPC